jgi:heme A synthase
MKTSLAHQCAVLAALLALGSITLGALLTSEIRTLPGATPAPVFAPGLQEAHMVAGYGVAIMTLIVVVVVSKWTGWSAVLAVIAEIFLGNLPTIHALLAPICFTLVVAIAVTTSKQWQTGARPVENSWRPLRPLGMAMPVLIVLQIGLGAAFRHNKMGVVSHILDALIVLVAILVAGVFVLRQYPEHPALRPAALTLVIVAGVQVLLGFSVYMVLLMSSENNMGLIATSVLHVVNGALVLAAAVVLTMQMERNLIQSSGA